MTTASNLCRFDLELGQKAKPQLSASRAQMQAALDWALRQCASQLPESYISNDGLSFHSSKWLRRQLLKLQLEIEPSSDDQPTLRFVPKRLPMARLHQLLNGLSPEQGRFLTASGRLREHQFEQLLTAGLHNPNDLLTQPSSDSEASDETTDIETLNSWLAALNHHFEQELKRRLKVAQHHRIRRRE